MLALAIGLAAIHPQSLDFDIPYSNTVCTYCGEVGSYRSCCLDTASTADIPPSSKVPTHHRLQINLFDERTTPTHHNRSITTTRSYRRIKNTAALSNMSVSVASLISLLLAVAPSTGFVVPHGTTSTTPTSTTATTDTNPNHRLSTTQPLWSSLKEKTDEKVDATTSTDTESHVDPDAEGLPWWWELVWKLDMMKTGEQGEEIIFGDSANVLRTNIEQIYGGYPSLDGCPLAEGEITDIGDGTMFIGLQNYYQKYGSPYKLCFGPKSFLVISDPVQARHLLRDANKNYDKVSANGDVATCLWFVPYWPLTLPLHCFRRWKGCSGRDFEAYHGKRSHSCRSRNLEGSSSPNRSSLSQKVVGVHGRPLWILQQAID